jgi:hypothetical protein
MGQGRAEVVVAVIEVCTFTAVGDEAALLAADARMQTDFAYAQPGLFRRTAARADGGRWCVVSTWASTEDAERADLAARSDEVARAFWALADPDTVRVERYSLLG